MKKVNSLILIIALFVAAFNLRLAINSISPLLETIQRDLNMSASISSLLTVIPVLCMGLFSPLAAKMGGRWGIERTIGWALGLIGFGTILRLYANSTPFLILTALIAGIGIAAVGPLLSGFIKRYFTNVPPMIAVYTVALSLGAAMSSGLTVPIQTALNSMQGSLAFWSIFGMIAVFIWWLFVLRRIKPTAKNTGTAPSTKMPWKNANAWLLTLSFALMAMLFYSVTAWLPPMIQSMGYSEVYASHVFTIFAFIQIPVSLVLPSLLKKVPSRLLWLSIATVFELIGFSMIFFNIQPWIAAIFIGLGAGMLFPLNLLLPIDMTKNSQEATSWSAMIQSVGYVIGAIGPLIIGWIHDTTNSFSIAISGMIAITILMIIVQFFAAPKSIPVKSKTV